MLQYIAEYVACSYWRKLGRISNQYQQCSRTHSPCQAVEQRQAYHGGLIKQYNPVRKRVVRTVFKPVFPTVLQQAVYGYGIITGCLSNAR